MPDLLPPFPRGDNTIPSALAVDDNANVYIFYYSNNDEQLHVANGTDGKAFKTTPITIGSNPIPLPTNALTPAPLAAGFDVTSKELHVFYIKDNDGTVGEVISKDSGSTWATGAIDSQQVKLPNLGALSAFSDGKTWRVIAKTSNNLDTITEVYQPEGNPNYIVYPIP